MDYIQLQNLVNKIQGCSFASIDATCYPKPGLKLVIQGERVILFTNKYCSGYENMVRRRIEEAGKDASLFVLGKLPWGTRVPDSPFIEHKGKCYLQTIGLANGSEKWFRDGIEIDVSEHPLAQRYHQPDRNRVEVHTYNIESIDRIALMGELLVAGEQRAITPLSV